MLDNLKDTLIRPLAFLIVTALISFSPSQAVSLDKSEVKRKNITIHRMLLKIYIAKSRKSDVLKEYEQLIKLTPNDSEIRHNYGTYLARMGMGMNSNALHQLLQAAKLDPASAEIEAKIGTVYLRSKKISKAVIHLNKAVQLGAGPEVQKQHKEAVAYINQMKKRKLAQKRQLEYRKRLERQRKQAEKNQQDEDDDDW